MSFKGLKYIICLLTIISCKQSENPPVYYTPDILASFSDFGTETFFSNISDIERNGNKYYFLDIVQNKVFCTDTLFNLLFSFIEEGEAESEATGLNKLSIFNDTLYVGDVSSGKIMVFNTNGKFIKSFRTDLWGIGDFFANDKEIIMFSDDDSLIDHPIAILNKATNEKSYIGSKADRNFKNPDRHVLNIDGSSFASIYAENWPIIEIYSSKGELLFYKDLSYLDLFTSVLDYSDLKIKNEQNTNVVLVPHAYYTHGILYLLISTMDKDNTWFSNHVMECILNNSEKSITVKRIIELDKNKWYESLYVDVDNNVLLAADHTNSSIDKYPLE